MTETVPEFDPETAVTIGYVLAPHGLKGEVKVQPLTDFPERFDAGAAVWLKGRPLRIEHSRWQRSAVYLRLEGVGDRNAAEGLRGQELQAPPAALGEDTYYRDDVIGLKVRDTKGQTLGELAEIFATGSNDVYVVRGPRGELLLPATDDVVLAIDLEKGTVLVEVVEGLEWEKRGSGKREEGGGRKRTPGRKPGIRNKEPGKTEPSGPAELV